MLRFNELFFHFSFLKIPLQKVVKGKNSLEEIIPVFKGEFSVFCVLCFVFLFFYFSFGCDAV